MAKSFFSNRVLKIVVGCGIFLFLVCAIVIVLLLIASNEDRLIDKNCRYPLLSYREVEHLTERGHNEYSRVKFANAEKIELAEKGNEYSALGSEYYLNDEFAGMFLENSKQELFLNEDFFVDGFYFVRSASDAGEYYVTTINTGRVDRNNFEDFVNLFIHHHIIYTATHLAGPVCVYKIEHVDGVTEVQYRFENTMCTNECVDDYVYRIYELRENGEIWYTEE